MSPPSCPPPAETDLWRSGALGYMRDGGVLHVADPRAWPSSGHGRRHRAVPQPAAHRPPTATPCGPRCSHLLQRGPRRGRHRPTAPRSRGPVPAILAVGLHRYEILRRLNYDAVPDRGAGGQGDGRLRRPHHRRPGTPFARVGHGRQRRPDARVASARSSAWWSMFQEGIVTSYGRSVRPSSLKLRPAGIKLKLIVTVWGLVPSEFPRTCFTTTSTTVVNRYHPGGRGDGVEARSSR